MGYVAKLKHGSRTLDLASGRYGVSEDFAPPTAQMTVNYSGGTSANRLGGSSRVSDRAENRSWTFGMHVRGDSIGEIRRAVDDLQSFLGWAGDNREPMYFQWNASDAVPTPAWGQDGSLLYEITDGYVSLPGENYYSIAALNKQGLPFCTVTLTVKPFAFGLPQTVAQARGSISHDTVGTAGGRDRGLVVSWNSTNKFTNPVFDHPTWNTGWSTGANMRSTVNADQQFVAFGVQSAKLESYSGSPIFVENLTLNVNNHAVSFYAKRPDGGVVNSSVCFVVLAGTGVASTYVPLGNGWYRVYAIGAASASSAGYGAGLASSSGPNVVYVDGFQCEEAIFTTPLATGDSLGCAWTGTAHASTTTRATSAFLRLPLDNSIFSSTRGSIRTVITTRDIGWTGYFWAWQEAATSMRLYYDVSLGRWYLTDNTNSVSFTSSLAANTTYVIHAVWDRGRLQLYINGASVASGATFAPASTAPTYLYIGSSPAPGDQKNAIVGGLTVWRDALTTAQVLADYENVSPIAADGQRVGEIPYAWTLDGDGIVDTYDDSTHKNYAVFQHVPGSMPADTLYEIAGSNINNAWVGLWQTREYIHPARVLYSEQSGTADGNSSGGAYRTSASVSTTEDDVTVSALGFASDAKLYRFVQGREWFAFARMRNVSAVTGRVRQLLIPSVYQNLYGKQYGAVSSQFFEQSLVPSIVFPVLDYSRLAFAGIEHYLMVTNSGASVVNTDFYCLFPRPLATFKLGLKTTIRGGEWSNEWIHSVSSWHYNEAGTTADSLDLAPDTHNVALFACDNLPQGSLGDENNIEMTYSRVIVTPRYSLL